MKSHATCHLKLDMYNVSRIGIHNTITLTNQMSISVDKSNNTEVFQFYIQHTAVQSETGIIHLY